MRRRIEITRADIGAFEVTPQNCTPRPSGMVGWYPGDGNANDISSTANHGMFVGGATTAPGMVLQAFSFDGVDDYVQMPSNAAQDPTTTATIDAWVRFSQTPSAAGRHMEIVSKGSFGSDFDLGALTDNKFYLYISGGINVGSTTVIQPNVWYHVAATWDATGLRMYVNGVLENTNPTPNVARTAQPTRPLTIGNGTEFDRNNRWFSGLIDEVEIFNRALSASEIQAIYNAGSAEKCKAPVTAASVAVGGRVTNANGRGIGKARVTLTGQSGELRVALTNAFGYFSFTDVQAGETYVISVSAKRFSFTPNTQVRTIGEDAQDINFVADP